MLTRTATLAFLALSVLVGQAADKNPLVRSIPLKLDRPEAKGDVNKPTVITSAAELAKAIPEQNQRNQVAREVDFKTHMLLFFVWSGSGRDKLTPKEEKGTVVFHYHAGETDDFHRHFQLFALPKDTKWQVKK